MSAAFFARVAASFACIRCGAGDSVFNVYPPTVVMAWRHMSVRIRATRTQQTIGWSLWEIEKRKKKKGKKETIFYADATRTFPTSRYCAMCARTVRSPWTTSWRVTVRDGESVLRLEIPVRYTQSFIIIPGGKEKYELPSASMRNQWLAITYTRWQYNIIALLLNYNVNVKYSMRYGWSITSIV